MTREELRELYEECGYLVHRRCRTLLGNGSDAEDAMQEVFVRIQRYDRGEAKGNVLGWLYTITNNVCFDLLKRRDATTPVNHEELAKIERRHEMSEATGDQRAFLGAVLRSLDSTTRNIGVMHHIEGYTQEEVASKTGYSRKTVGKKLAQFHAAFARLFSPTQKLGSSS